MIETVKNKGLTKKGAKLIESTSGNIGNGLDFTADEKVIN